MTPSVTSGSTSPMLPFVTHTTGPTCVVISEMLTYHPALNVSITRVIFPNLPVPFTHFPSQMGVVIPLLLTSLSHVQTMMVSMSLSPSWTGLVLIFVSPNMFEHLS